MKLAQVTVVGSLSVDFVMRVPRRPAKGETIAGFDFQTFVGGKGNNQALAAARAGAHVYMVGRIGQDSYGDKILDTLQRNAVDTKYLVRDTEVGTGIANIFVDPEGDNSIVIVPQANGRLSACDIEAAAWTISESQVIVLQMEIPDEAILAAARTASSAGALVLLNPAPAPPSGKLPAGLLSEVDLVIPNQSEAQLLTGIEVVDFSSAKKAARLLQELGVKSVIITMGAQGAYACESNGSDYLVPSYNVDAVDTTAAGDAFCGALAAGIASGLPLPNAVRMGCAAGALAVTVCGAEPSLPMLAEIEKLCLSSPSAG